MLLLNIEAQWKKVLQSFFSSDTFLELSSFVKKEYEEKKVYPHLNDIFKAFSLTPFNQVKVVILGQDPYHNSGQAHGLAFSVPSGVVLPPSLKNIYKEIGKDSRDGNLEPWAKQGVLLLNSILTVVADQPASHRGKGWEKFSDEVIKKISEEKEPVVFMLWGADARSKKALINTKKHLVLEAPHPSPLSAYRGFFSCGHFRKCNEYLKSQGKEEIRW